MISSYVQFISFVSGHGIDLAYSYQQFAKNIKNVQDQICSDFAQWKIYDLMPIELKKKKINA